MSTAPGTEALAEQVFEALTSLLAGLEAAAGREGTPRLEEALARGADPMYGGLLATLLRLVFVLYAEERGLLPGVHSPPDVGLPVRAQYEQLREAARRSPEALRRGLGAWPRLLARVRALLSDGSPGGAWAASRRDPLFDPETSAFLEGGSIDDETVHQVLEKLLTLEGQPLDYPSLDVEQLGSVYETLMGFHIQRLTGVGVCLRPAEVWISADEVLAQPAVRRGAWLAERIGLEPRAVKGASQALEGTRTEAEVLAALEPYRVKDRERARAGQLVPQPGAARRRTRSHYTPRGLSAPIVRRALEPLLQAMGEHPSSERLLHLKLCDPAMGSGAFLVEACRVLGDQLLAAWRREGVAAPADEEGVMCARRLVAQHCLYGVDKNPWAVSLARLSLWLATRASAEPFTFLDHCLKCGDSLVGLDLGQIRAFHWDGRERAPFEPSRRVVQKALAVALEKRRTLLRLVRARPLEARRREALLRGADEALEPVRRLADACVGAFFAGDSPRTRERERTRRRDVLGEWLSGAERGRAPAMPEAVRQLSAPGQTFHWPLEFPELFHGRRPDPLEGGGRPRATGVDGFVGNPPFAGKNGIVEANGEHYLPWLQTVHPGAHGNADLSAHFLRRAFHLLGARGTIGFIATNTIAQGDTRTTGLQFLLERGAHLYDATRSMKWPVPGAEVAVSVVHVAKGRVPGPPLEPRLDGQRVEHLNSRLRVGPERAAPVPLRGNLGLAYRGTIVLGMGFTLTPEEAAALGQRSSDSTAVLHPYLGADEVNSSPDQTAERHVIDFGDRSLEEVHRRWPALLRWVRERVKPERDLLKGNSTADRRRELWWQHGAPAIELDKKLRGLRQCWVIPNVTKHLTVSRQPARQVFSNTLIVVPAEEPRFLVALQSRVHEVWARLLSSSLEDRLRYSPSDCLETFPFPEPPAFAALDRLGARFDTRRRAYMTAHGVGLTALYNRLKDQTLQSPAVRSLRALHEAVDRAVLDAYGWSHVQVPPYCGATPGQWEAFEEDVLDRLFALNARRAHEEARTRREDRGVDAGPNPARLPPGP